MKKWVSGSCAALTVCVLSTAAASADAIADPLYGRGSEIGAVVLAVLAVVIITVLLLRRRKK